MLARLPAASLDPQKFDYVRRTRLSPLRMTRSRKCGANMRKTKRRLRRLHLISHMSQSDLRQLLLKEKPADAVLSTVDLLFFFYRRKHFKICVPKARNLVSLPLEGKETAVGCRMRCSRRRRRFFRMFAPHIPYASSLRRRQSRRISLRDTP